MHHKITVSTAKPSYDTDTHMYYTEEKVEIEYPRYGEYFISCVTLEKKIE